MISIKDDYKKQAEHELEFVHARSAEFKGKEKIMDEEVLVRYGAQIDTFERGIDSLMLKMKKVYDAGGGAWKHLRDGVQSALHSSGSMLGKNK
ncbi:MAG: hypothetical protein HGB36_05105 [Chlorobiaceae bacterium]|nr:hypothetical protein [Chlorobiaceae bacterium]